MQRSRPDSHNYDPSKAPNDGPGMHDFYDRYGVDGPSYHNHQEAHQANMLYRKMVEDEEAAIQRKPENTTSSSNLTINTPGDQYEQEADNLANRVAGTQPLTPAKSVIAGRVPSLQAKGNATAPPAGFDSKLNATKGAGTPLPNSFKTEVEGHTGKDLSGVRVHTDSNAANMAKDVSAKAFTHGSDIYGPAKNLDPGQSEGKHTLAHEVGHTMQQNGAGIKREVDPKAVADDYFRSESAYNWETLRAQLGSDGSREQDMLVTRYLLDNQPSWSDILAQDGTAVAKMEDGSALPAIDVSKTAFEAKDETSLVNVTDQNVEYTTSNFFIGRKSRKAKAAESSARVNELLDGKSSQLSAMVSAVESGKGKLKGDLGAGVDALRDKVVDIANKKSLQVQAHINEVVVTAAAARADARIYYYGSTTVIDNNTETQQARLDTLYAEAQKTMSNMQMAQEGAIDAQYQSYFDQMANIVKGYAEKSDNYRADLDAKYRSSRQKSGAEAVEDAMWGAYDTEVAAQDEVIAADKKESLLIEAGEQRDIMGIYNAATLQLRSSADQNKASALSLRRTTEARIDELESELLLALEDELQSSYAQLALYLEDTISKLEAFYTAQTGSISDSANTAVSDAQDEVSAFATTEDGQKKPKKKDFQAKLDNFDAESSVTLDAAKFAIDADLATMQKETERMLTEADSNLDTLNLEIEAEIQLTFEFGANAIETYKEKRNEAQLQLRRDHLNNIIYDINQAEKDFDAEILELEEKYAAQIDKIEESFIDKLVAFRTKVKDAAVEELKHQAETDAKVEYLEKRRLASIKKRGETEWYTPRWTWLLGAAGGITENAIAVWDAIPTVDKIANVPGQLSREISSLEASKGKWSNWNYVDPSGTLGFFWLHYNIGYYKHLQQMEPVDYILALDNHLRAPSEGMYYAGILAGIIPGIGSWFEDIWHLITTIGGLLKDAATVYGNMVLDQLGIIDTGPSIFEKMSAWFADPNNIEMLKGLFEMHQEGALVPLLKTIAGSVIEGMGASAAADNMEYYMLPPYEQGYAIGEIIGYLIPEVVLLFFSASIGNIAKKALEGVTRIVIKIGEGIKWVGTALKEFFESVSWIEKLINALKNNEKLQGFVKMLQTFLDDAKRLVTAGDKAGVDHVDDVKTTTPGDQSVASNSTSTQDVYHTKSDAFVQNVIDEIDPKYFNEESRFGQGFYIAEEGEVAIAEVAHHGIDPNKAKVIRFELDHSKLNTLDLTDPSIAKAWKLDDAFKLEKQAEITGQANAKYEPFQGIAEKAKVEGYNSIKFPSQRANGNNFVIFGDSKSFFKEVLSPQMVSPATL